MYPEIMNLSELFAVVDCSANKPVTVLFHSKKCRVQKSVKS